MKISLGDFSEKVVREDIFKPTVGNESLHGTSTNHNVIVVISAISKNLVVKSTMFPYHKVHIYTWTLPIETQSD
jgi:hypothetical protein